MTNQCVDGYENKTCPAVSWIILGYSWGIQTGRAKNRSDILAVDMIDV